MFVPISASVGEGTRLAVTLIMLAAFSLPMYRALPFLKRLLDSLSVPLARKRRFRMLDSGEAEALVGSLLYMTAGIAVFLLYLPFLLWLQPVFAGIALLCLLLWCALMMLRVATTVGRIIIEWTYS